MDRKTAVPISSVIISLLFSFLFITLTSIITYIVTLKKDISLLNSLLEEKNKRMEILEKENEQLRERLNPFSEIWLPDSLTFAGRKIPLDNWYVRNTLKDILASFLDPRSNGVLVTNLRRSKYWFPYIEKQIKHEDFFEDIKYLFVQESALDPTARSYVGALGIAQFMEETATKYGLRVDYWTVDERLLPEKAISAAIRYLKDNYEKFNNDIFLAMAAYNAGGVKLEEALKRHKGEANYFHLGYLPQETRDFVYKIIAWKLIIENKEKYNIYDIYEKKPFEEYEYPPVVLKDTTLPKTTDISEVASFYKMGHPEFEKLNPHVTTNILPRGEYTFRIPKIENLNQNQTPK